jgi:hypothetical protein
VAAATKEGAAMTAEPPGAQSAVVKSPKLTRAADASLGGKPTPARAFALAIVLLVVAMAAAVALGIQARGLESRLRGARSQQVEVAQGIAQGGYQRAKGYAETVAAVFGDFDRLLDPGLNASCTLLPGGDATCAAGLCNVPDYTNDSIVTYLGREYSLVPFNGGAYLTRFDDDADDQPVEASWDRNTSNNIDGVNCIEGPVSITTGRNNLFRDRNRAVLITVVGIAPGTNPATATNRSVFRQLYVNPNPGSLAGVAVKGNINVTGSATIYACSPVGSIQADGNFTGLGGGACACGDTVADSVGLWGHCTNAPYASPDVCAGVGCAPGTLSTPGPTPGDVVALDSNVGKNIYFDWTKPCTYFHEHAGAAATQLWVWDPTALRGPAGVACSSIASDDGAAYPAPPAPASGNYSSCWTPLLLAIDGACPDLWGPVVAPADPDERGTACGWAPDDDVNVATGVQVNARRGASLPAVPDAGTFRKPNFAAECTVSYPGQPPNKSCTGFCTGANTVFVEGAGPAPYWFKADSAAEIRAVPAGVYIYGSVTLDLGSTDMAPAAFPNTLPPLDLDQFPLATIATTGSVASSGIMFLGVGTDKASARFPSIIANGTITLTGGTKKSLAGSIWSTGNMNWNGSSEMYLFGELHLNGNWDLGGTGAYRWRYMNVFSGVDGTAALPLSFQSQE